MENVSETLSHENGYTIGLLIDSALEKRRKTPVYGLLGSSRAYLLSKISATSQAPLVVIVPTHREAQTLCEDFRFFRGEDEPLSLLYPAWDTLPWDTIPPTPDTTAQRLKVLFHLSQNRGDVYFASARSVLQKVLPREMLRSRSMRLKKGEEVDRDHMIRGLIRSGYVRVDTVEDWGEFAVRGGLVDVFSPFYDQPLRLEWFGDRVVSLRYFNPDTQRSSSEVEEAFVIPSEERIQNGDDAGSDDFFTYLSEKHLLVLDSPGLLIQEMTKVREDLQERFERATVRSRNVRSPEDFCSDPHEVSQRLMDRARIILEPVDIKGDSREPEAIARFQVEENTHLRREILDRRKNDRLLEPLVKKIERCREGGVSVFFVSRSSEQANRLGEVLEEYEIRADNLRGPFSSVQNWKIDRPTILVGELSGGFCFPQEGLACVTDEEIFGERRKIRSERRKRGTPLIPSFGDLNPGDPVVHLDYGIGIYRGLQRLDVRGCSNDYLLLEYLGGDKLYVPVHRLNLVQRYVGGGEKRPRLDRLGGTGWKRLKKKVAAAVEKMARELLDIYAARRLFKGFPFSRPDRYFKEFEARFEYDETPDQSQAIEDVLMDMERPAPMDRLICGDVGYGKTEVAIRAAFKAVMDAKQVAVLVPTTILAQQHYVTFSERLKDYPVVIESLSRFKTKKQQRETLEKLEKGTIDIVVGTHRLLQGDLKFRDLGLLIVDEEHRFGVSHKEKLKKLKKLVDVVTLSATPIPRTLHMSLTGIRDMSAINTPPQDRQSIRTFLYPFDRDVIREAILQEFKRGGQTFFVHNRVHNIMSIADYLRTLVPEVRLAVAHGQMDERDLEKVMLDFITRQIDVLVCTSIIESGLDIPTANTIIINHAEQFGLADLYQLRGRVGRSKEQAYAYLIVPGESVLSRDALKRLRAIQEFTELGSGFKLAMQDLEIRGAGNLLGSQQSGHIAAVGFEMYTQLIEKAIKRFRGEEIEEEISPEIRWNKPAFIPDSYVENPHQRLSIYKRLSAVQSDTDVDDMRSELEDRYGPVPEPVSNLLAVMRVKPILKQMRVRAFDFNEKRVVLTFDRSSKVEPSRILDLVTGWPDRVRFTPDFRLKVELKGEEDVYQVVSQVFEELGRKDREPKGLHTSALSIG
jgi:transcription-repair coupling factor (superfamily II helicase)